MIKIHIGKNGPAICKATKGRCPLGGESGMDNHFEGEHAMENAGKVFDEMMKKEIHQKELEQRNREKPFYPRKISDKTVTALNNYAREISWDDGNNKNVHDSEIYNNSTVIHAIKRAFDEQDRVSGDVLYKANPAEPGTGEAVVRIFKDIDRSIEYNIDNIYKYSSNYDDSLNWITRNSNDITYVQEQKNEIRRYMEHKEKLKRIMINDITEQAGEELKGQEKINQATKERKAFLKDITNRNLNEKIKNALTYENKNLNKTPW